MMQYIRERTNSPFVKLLFLGILLSFMGLGGTAIFGSSGKHVAKVNGVKISEDEVRREYDYLINSQGFEGLSADDIQALKVMARERVINQAILLQKIEEWGYRVSDGAIVQELHRTPFFLDEEGVFSQQRYQDILRQNGLTPAQYENSLRVSMAIEELQRDLVAGAFTAKDTLAAWAVVDNEARDIEVATFNYDDLEDQSFSVSEEEVKIAFESNQDKYIAPARVKLQYIELSLDEMNESPSEEELAEAKEQFEAALNAGDEAANQIIDRAEMRISEQIIMSAKSEEEKEHALKSLTAIYNAVSGNKMSFDQVIEELEEGMEYLNVGSLSRGVIGIDEIDDLLFSLTEENPIAKPIVIDGNAHLIYLKEIVKSRDEAIREHVVDNYQLNQYLAKEDELRDLVVRYPNNIDQIAEELGVEAVKSDWLSLVEREGVLGNELLFDAVNQAILLDEGMSEGQLFELAQNHGIYLIVSDYEPARAMSFEESKSAVERELLNFKRAEHLEGVLEALQDRLIENPELDFSEEVLELGFTYRSEQGVTRLAQMLQGAFGDEALMGRALSRAFEPQLERDESAFFAVERGDDGIAIIRVSNIQEGSIQDYEEGIRKFRDQSSLEFQKQQELGAILDAMRAESKVIYYESNFMNAE